MMHKVLRNTVWGPPVRPGYWFAPKRYGFGAVPATVMGWVATSLYLMLAGLAMAGLPTDRTRIIVASALTIAFIAIVWLKTDGGFRWRWGGENK